MNQILGQEALQFTTVYVDDLLITSETWEEHCYRVESVSYTHLLKEQLLTGILLHKETSTGNIIPLKDRLNGKFFIDICYITNFDLAFLLNLPVIYKCL